MLEGMTKMKLGRNDKCWCGSGKKYKACHMAMDEKIYEYQIHGAVVPDHDMIKTKEQIDGIRRAGEINTQVLDYISEYVKVGVNTEELDRRIDEYTRKLGGIPACLGYQGYPKSVCISPNEVICHGIPSKSIDLMDGDIANIDCTTIVDGYYGDASRMFEIGNVSEEKRKLVKVTKECLDLALKEVKPFAFLGDIGEVIQTYAEANGYSVVREIGGHGVGVEFHENPWVCHLGKRGTGMLLVPGMTFTIEPMINMGKAKIKEDKNDGWTVRTADGKPSAQWEYTILVTESGAEVLSY